MERVFVKKKTDRLLIIHKIGRAEQINAMELDIINRNEIPALLPISFRKGIGSNQLRFVVSSLIDLESFVKSRIGFDRFTQVVLQIIDAIQGCESHGIRCGNLELDTKLSFYDYASKNVRLLYWPLISMTSYANTQSYFLELGNGYFPSTEDEEFRNKYLQFFDTREKFDVERFRQYVEKLVKQWQDAQPEVHTSSFGSGKIRQAAMLKREKNQKIIQVTHFPFVIGRHPQQCDYTIDGDDCISKKHASILLRNEMYFIRDNGSANGTRVDGKLLHANAEAELHSGSVIRIGKEEFKFFVGGN